MPQTKHPGNTLQLLSSVTVAHLPARHPHAHKGDFGHVLVVGGDLGTGGAVLLSAEAALRCGAGLVSVVMTGRHDVKRVSLDDSLMQEDKEILEDLIAAAVNDAVRKIEQNSQDKMSGMTSGMQLPPGFKMPF